MIINKLKIIKGDNFWEEEFSDGVNIINASKNQLGKSTIIKSIIYAVGAKEKIFDKMEKIPDMVILTINGFIIKRSETSWFVNDHKVTSGKDIMRLIGEKPAKIRVYGGAVGDVSLSALFSMMTLFQTRLDRSKDDFWNVIQASEKNDVMSLLQGFKGVEEFVRKLDDERKILKHNIKVANTLNLGNYVLNDEIKVLENFESYEKRLNVLNKALRSTYENQRKSQDILDTASDESDYMEAVSTFAKKVSEIEGINDPTTKYLIADFIKKEFGYNEMNTISLTEIEAAQSSLKAEGNQREEIKKEIMIVKENAMKTVEQRELVNELISYAIAKKSKLVKSNEKIDTEGIDELRNERQEIIDDIAAKEKRKMESLGIKPGTEGIAQVASYIIKRIYWKQRYKIPLLIDSGDEVAAKDVFLQKIISPCMEFQGQVIFTSMQDPETYQALPEIKVINIESEILE